MLRAHPGQLAVGVIDETAGQRAFYHATQQFSSAGVITADILAALLIRHQQAGTMLTSVQSGLVTAMMDTADHVNGAGSRSDAAAVSLWRAIGGGQGLAADNRLLKLSHTIPGSGDRWDQTQTTAADQLQLLTDLTSARSPLTGSARDYALRLMTRPTPLRWGVAAAGQLATNSTGAARSEVADGSLRLGQDWVVASIGIVRHAGHVLLVAVLSSRTLSRAAGISLVSAAAVAAADVVS